MELINTNRLRISIRFFRRGYAERMTDLCWGRYYSGDHGKPRLETNYYFNGFGLVAHVKWRPDGKYAALGGEG